MNDLPTSGLKTILHSKRTNIYYLEHCRIMQEDGCLLYLTESKKNNLYYNIPIANTTVILLASSTAITRAAVRMMVFQLADVATAEPLLRPVQSVPSPKAEPIKLWLTKVEPERMQKMADPAISLNCARETWQNHAVRDWDSLNGDHT